MFYFHQALASTVSRDISAPHYKYHDDPYLIPSSNVGKRTFALAKESGRKAAQWILQQHPELFDTSLAQPPVPVSIVGSHFTVKWRNLQGNFETRS
jgi:hypothetical protein